MMDDSKLQLNLSEARTKLTQLDKLLKPGESLQVNKRALELFEEIKDDRIAIHE